MFGNGLWVIFLEIAAALALAIFMVWWTVPRRKHVAPGRGKEPAIRAGSEQRQPLHTVKELGPGAATDEGEKQGPGQSSPTR